MNSVRTPADRFGDLDDFPYAVARAELADGLSMAYVETGPADGPAVVLVHGEPTWGYLYRRMIPTLVDAGLHVIVPPLMPVRCAVFTGNDLCTTHAIALR